MYGGSMYAGDTFAGALAFALVPAVVGGIGGSGMSDEEYQRLLRRLGAPTADDLREEEALLVLAAFGYV